MNRISPSTILAAAVAAAAVGHGSFASCPGDLDGSGLVDGNDLGLLFSAWGPCPGGPCQADLSGNGTVGPEDLGILLAAWGG